MYLDMSLYLRHIFLNSNQTLVAPSPLVITLDRIQHTQLTSLFLLKQFIKLEIKMFPALTIIQWAGGTFQ